MRQVPVSAISPNQFQPRKAFNDESLQSLASSVRELGVLQPIIVRPLEGEPNRYELIAGERRWRAAGIAGLETVPVLVQDSVNDRLSLEQAVVENLHRVDLHPLEEAAAYQQLIDEFDLTHEQVAQRVGKSRANITNTLRLLATGRNRTGGPCSIADLGRSREVAAGDQRPRRPGDDGGANHQE